MIIKVLAGMLTVSALLLLFTVLFRGSSIRPDIDTVSKANLEIISIAERGLDGDQSSQSVKNTAANIKALTSHNLLQLNNYINDNYTAPPLSDSSSEQLETALESLDRAEQSNRFNEEFRRLAPLVISISQTAIESLFDKTEDPDLQTILNSTYEQNALLQEELSPTQSST